MRNESRKEETDVDRKVFGRRVDVAVGRQTARDVLEAEGLRPDGARQPHHQVAVEAAERPAPAGHQTRLDDDARIVGLRPQRHAPKRQARPVRGERLGAARAQHLPKEFIVCLFLCFFSWLKLQKPLFAHDYFNRYENIRVCVWIMKRTAKRSNEGRVDQTVKNSVRKTR